MDLQGHIKVIDFGIGQIVSESNSTSTQVFTLDTASPEQILGGQINTQSDIFSLGAVLLQLLVKKTPLPKIKNVTHYDPQADVKHIANLLDESDLDKDLSNIIKTATHIDQEKRYASMQLFAQDLHNWYEKKPISATNDSYHYRIKKFYQRNKAISLTTLFSILFVTISIFSVNYINKINDETQRQKENSIAIIDALFDQANPMLNKQTVNRDDLINTLENLAEQQKTLLQSDSELNFFFYQKLGETYFHNGLYEKALINFEKALESHIKSGKPASNATLTIRTNIYNALDYLGDTNKAIQLANELLSDFDSVPNADPTHKLNAYNLLMKIHTKLMELGKALAISEKSQIYLGKYPNIDQAMQSNMYATMAVIYRKTNHFVMAEKLFKKAITMKRLLKNEAVGLAQILVNLANFYRRQGKLNESDKHLQEGMKILSELDENHPNLDFVYHSYSILLKEQGEIKLAIKFLDKALLIAKEHNHQLIIFRSYEKYARLNLSLYNVTPAINNIIKSYENKVITNGIDHPHILDLYVLSLWILMLEPDSSHASTIINYITKNTVVNNTHSNQYQTILVQKTIIEQKPIINTRPDSLITQYLFNPDLVTDAKKTQWLKNNIKEIKEPNNLIAVWLNSQLFLLSPIESDFQSYCNINAKWHNSANIMVKKMILEVCIKATNNKDITKIYNKLMDSQQNNQQLKQQLVGLLTKIN